MTRQSSATIDQATEIARLRTLAGQMTGNVFKYTQILRTGIGQHEIRCSACGQAGWADEARTSKVQFKFQSDATDATRTHANRCLA